MANKKDYKFITKTRTPEWKAERQKLLKKLDKSNKVSEKHKKLMNPKIMTPEHYEFLYEAITVKYIKSKEIALVNAFHEISGYMKTIDEQHDTILWLKADLNDKKEVHELYYDRILEWTEVLKASREEVKKVWSDRNDAIRSYNGLLQMQKSAKDLGIDTRKFVLPEEDEKKYKDYEFSVNGKVLESGRTSYRMSVTKKRKRK